MVSLSTYLRPILVPSLARGAGMLASPCARSNPATLGPYVIGRNSPAMKFEAHVGLRRYLPSRV